MRSLSIALVLATLVAGCAAPASTVTPPPTPDAAFDDLASTADETVIGENGTVAHTFRGASTGGAGALGETHEVDGTPIGTFDVDARVGFAELVLVDTSGAGTTGAVLLDADARILCAAFVDAPCSAPVPPTSGPLTWGVDGRPVLGAQQPGGVFEAIVTLHPPSHMTIGDPLAGVDPSITFRVSDTGVDGSEDNIGVLPDGTIFTQKSLATMRSTDDGATWTNVAPPLNSQESLDPMLFVDPWREIVFVDHLYVACSQLSWSSDAGETWLQNPAACGAPANDHQKIASGPNPVPLAPLPAVYYTYSSFADGVWASRSYDGGLSWTSVPVVGFTDARSYANTGPIFADEEGNVYIPLYMCDGEGYMGVGVSNDHGMTWRFVVAAEDPGPCYDVDPGLWTDGVGNVYLAYHRPTGVKYVVSEDHGATWSAPVVVSPPSLKSFVHVDAVAGAEGRLAIVYRATPDTDKGPDLADGWAGWHLYVTFVENATSDTPTIRTAIVNDPDSPVQRGPVCTSGVTCYGGSRNLLDFIDIAVGPDGRVYPTYTDGCETTCPTPADSRLRLGHVGVQESGPRLFVDAAPWAS